MNADQIVKNVITNLPGVDFELRKGETLKFHHRGFMKFEAEDSAGDLKLGTFILTNGRCGIVPEGGYEYLGDFLSLNGLRVIGVVRRYLRELEAQHVPGVADGWADAIELKLPVGNLGQLTVGSYFIGFIPDDKQLCLEVSGAIRTLADRATAANRDVRGASTTVIIEREIVKVQCRYCGTLNDMTARDCVSCGAPLR